jgi:Tfp pilus assembly protein PilV
MDGTPAGSVAPRRLRAARARLRGERGLGLIELLVAMTVLALGILSVFALFSSSAVAIQRASTATTAGTLADSRMERFRAVTFDTIGLTSAQLAGVDATYTGDSAYRAPGTNQANQAVTIASSTFTPTQTVTGADGRPYRVDTFITWRAVTGGRDLKLVTVVVRDSASPAKTYARVISAFDRSTG